MKKLAIILSLMILATAASFGQALHKQMAFGAKAVDSLYGAVGPTYYYVQSAAATTGKTAATYPVTHFNQLKRIIHNGR